jgi:hypothetical protein
LGRLGSSPTDPAAWEAFVDRHGPKICAWCRHWKLQPADAEDVTQGGRAHLVQDRAVADRYNPLAPGDAARRFPRGKEITMRRSVLLLGGVLLLAGGPPGETDAGRQPARKVEGQVLTSTEKPAVRLRFAKEFKYVGGQDFILYDVARAEQHFFVDADQDGKIKQLYWVQFEGYLPSNTHTYRYPVKKTVQLGGLEFIADAYARNTKAAKDRPGSDGSRARTFLEGKGYRFAGDDTLSQRLVHLVDAAKRDELMVIYLEDLGRLGFTAADLAPGGRAADQWDEVARGVLERAVKGMEVLR